LEKLQVYRREYYKEFNETLDITSSLEYYKEMGGRPEPVGVKTQGKWFGYSGDSLDNLNYNDLFTL